MSEHLDAFHELHRVLVAAQERRRALTGFIDGEAEWVVYERIVMHAAPNLIRERAGKPDVPMAAIRRAEQSACGHSDYTKKFALGCAELATRDERPTP